jgi:hypothetical protein
LLGQLTKMAGCEPACGHYDTAEDDRLSFQRSPC